MSMNIVAHRPTTRTAPFPNPRVVGLVTSMAPYHHARWQAYAELSGAECSVVELTNRDEFAVLEVSTTASKRYERVSLFEGRDAQSLRPAEVHRALHRLLAKIQPDGVCINGYASTMSYAGLQWCRENRRPAVVCSESNAFDQPRKRIKEFVKRKVLQSCSAGLAGGRPQAAYLAELGIPRERVFTGYDVVDNDHFAAGMPMRRASRIFSCSSQEAWIAAYVFRCVRAVHGKEESFLRNRRLCTVPLADGIGRQQRFRRSKGPLESRAAWRRPVAG